MPLNKKLLNIRPDCLVRHNMRIASGEKRRNFNLLDADNTCFTRGVHLNLVFRHMRPQVPGIRFCSLPSEFVKHHQRRGWGEGNSGVCVPTSREIKQVGSQVRRGGEEWRRTGNEERKGGERKEEKKRSRDSQSPWCILGVEPGRRN